MQTESFIKLLASDSPLVMGVLNVTPDSFSDGGRYVDLISASEHASRMIADGADIVDIGGQSTRPPGSTYGAGADVISGQEELGRVIPVIERIVSEHPEAIISIDTTRSEVARQAIAIGATIINDVSAATQDENMFAVAAAFDAPIILMHGYGHAFIKKEIEEYHYNDVIRQVGAWLEERIEKARKAGISDILADVGFGFAKTARDNISLLKYHHEFCCLGVPMVIGVSRKSTIGKMLGGAMPEDRLYGSLAAAIWGALNGAKILRVHDVRETVEALKVVSVLRLAND